MQPFFLKARGYKLKAAFGFTLVELLIVVALVGILSAGVAVSFWNVNKTKALDTEAQSLVGLLNRARAQTLSAKDGFAYGVHFETSKAVLFRAPAYISTSTFNINKPLPREVNITAIALTGGGSETLFKKLTGQTDQSGTITLALVSNASASTTVVIGATGIAYSK